MAGIPLRSMFMSHEWHKSVRYKMQVTASGFHFSVPEHIVRIDDDGLRGWQLRYGEWTFYPDVRDGFSASEKALDAAVCEMLVRIDTLGK